MNTIIEYLYRDAENNKQCRREILPGQLTKDQLRRIHNSVNPNHEFIPEAVGLPTCSFDDYQEDIDTPIHMLLDFILTNSDVTINIPLETLVQQFEACAGKWDELAASGKFTPDCEPVSDDIQISPGKKPENTTPYENCNMLQVLILTETLANLIVSSVYTETCQPTPWSNLGPEHLSSQDIKMLAVGILLHARVNCQCIEHFTGTITLNDGTSVQHIHDETIYFLPNYMLGIMIPIIASMNLNQFTGNLTGVGLNGKSGKKA